MEPSPVSEPSPGSRRRGARPTLQLSPETLHSRDLSPPAGQAVPARSGDGGFDLDLEALDRFAEEAQAPFFQQINDLPPPPASVYGKRPGVLGTPVAYAPAGTPAADPAKPPGPTGRTPPPPAPAAPPGGASAGRYAPSRPASIFATNRPSEGASIFGEDLISEKSLDEVILSYLAEDLEAPSNRGDKK